MPAKRGHVIDRRRVPAAAPLTAENGHGQNSNHRRGTVPRRLSNRANRPTAAQAPGTAGHEHLSRSGLRGRAAWREATGVRLLQHRVVTGLPFSQASVYWHLRVFPSREAAEAAKSPTGIVVEEAGRIWLSEFGPRNTAPQGGEAIAIVGPLQLPEAKSYAAVLSYAVMRPGDSSRVHTHPGPEGWYVLAGEQCLETPAGATRARAGDHDGAIEYANGTKRHWYDAQACVRSGHPRFGSGERHTL